MNFIDNLISYFSPETAAKRQAWRNVLEEQRHYDAGGYDRLNSGWTAYNDSAENTDRYSRDTLRARARDLERNSDMGNSVIGAFTRNITGLGVTLQVKTADENLNNQIEELWSEWTKKLNCDVTASQSLSQMLRMAVKRKKVDGGILLKKCYTSGGVVPFKLQAIEVDELDETRVTPKYKANKVVGGIELDRNNRPSGYWIKQYSMDGFSFLDPLFVPAKDMIYLWSKKRPSQVREISDMAHTLTRVRDVNEFMVAVSVKQRIEACLAVFVKQAVPVSGIGRSSGATANKREYDGKLITPGMIKTLNAGDEIQVVNPTGQGQDAAAFVKLNQRLIGAGQGLSYEATSRDMSQSNYSSARQGIIEDSMTYIEDKELITEVMDEIFETFVISAVLCGALNIPGFWENKRTYFKHVWVATPKPWIDPLKEANATSVALATGQKTFQEIAGENGRDWKDAIDDMAEAIAYAESKGIDLNAILYKVQNGNEVETNGFKPEGE